MPDLWRARSCAWRCATNLTQSTEKEGAPAEVRVFFSLLKGAQQKGSVCGALPLLHLTTLRGPRVFLTFAVNLHSGWGETVCLEAGGANRSQRELGGTLISPAFHDVKGHCPR